MDFRDRPLKKFANDEVPKDIKHLWEPILWGAINRDMLFKVMGKTPCEREERETIRQTLLQEERYELFVAMMYVDAQEQGPECTAEQGEMDAPDGERYQMLVRGQLYSFLRWCDEKDRNDLFAGGSALDLYRLCYLALSVGYQKLALSMTAHMKGPQVQEGGEVLGRLGDKAALLRKKWVRDFCRKQPVGAGRNRLVKRLARQGIFV